MRLFILLTVVAVSLAVAPFAKGQDLPPEYQQVLDALGKTGDYKANVLKVNIPRSDLQVTVAGVKTPTPFGFGGWVAMTRGSGGTVVMMGDLVLTQEEVNPVLSALLDNGLEVTALHNHFFWEEPRVFYMHVHGMGSASDLARKLQPAIKLIDEAAKRRGTTALTSPPPPSAQPVLDTAALARIVCCQSMPLRSSFTAPVKPKLLVLPVPLKAPSSIWPCQSSRTLALRMRRVSASVLSARALACRSRNARCIERISSLSYGCVSMAAFTTAATAAESSVRIAASIIARTCRGRRGGSAGTKGGGYA